jgi:hypothetical protein
MPKTIADDHQKILLAVSKKFGGRSVGESIAKLFGPKTQISIVESCDEDEIALLPLRKVMPA